MASFIIPILDPMAPGTYFNPAAYPGDGVFFHSGSFWCVSSGMVTQDCFGIVPEHALTRSTKDAGKGGVTEALLLKALAISQKPELAKDLTE